jgi:hypothetical protein
VTDNRDLRERLQAAHDEMEAAWQTLMDASVDGDYREGWRACPA